MTTTSTVPVTVDGTRLDTLAYNVETLGDRINAPGVGTGNVDVPMRHGVLWTPNKTFQEGTLGLSMWVSGADVDGNVPPAGLDSQFRENLDALLRLFGVRHRLLDVRQTWPQGVRQCMAEVTEAIDFSTMPGPRRAARFVVGMRIPAAFWQDVDEQTVTVGPGTTTLAAFAAATAPIEDATYVIRNPSGAAVANPRITDVTSGAYVQVNASIPAGGAVTLRSGNWTVTAPATLANVVHAGSGARFLTLRPAPGGPVVRLDGAGLALDVTARRKYLA